MLQTCDKNITEREYFLYLSNLENFSVRNLQFQIATVVNMALDKYFPADEGVSIIAEPGRYFVASAFTLGVNIIAKRAVARDQHGESKYFKSFLNTIKPELEATCIK